MSDSERRLPVLRQRGWERESTPIRLGQLYTTPGALHAAATAGDTLFPLVVRHASGDWGDVCPEDWRANDRARTEGTRLLSSYRLRDGTEVWIITEADRSSTTVLLPAEY